MRLLFLPYDLVNYVCGALRITWSSFLLATALGSLPGTVSFVLLGASLERVDQGLDGIASQADVDLHGCVAHPRIPILAQGGLQGVLQAAAKVVGEITDAVPADLRSLRRAPI